MLQSTMGPSPTATPSLSLSLSNARKSLRYFCQEAAGIQQWLSVITYERNVGLTWCFHMAFIRDTLIIKEKVFRLFPYVLKCFFNTRDIDSFFSIVPLVRFQLLPHCHSLALLTCFFTCYAYNIVFQVLWNGHLLIQRFWLYEI